MELQRAFTRPDELLRAVALDPADFSADVKARQLFPLRVPRPFVQLMEVGNPHDPLLRQVLPLRQEFHTPAGYSTDPLHEQSADTAKNEAKGLLHKYRSRVLIILKGGCAINCRYCFRRHFPYDEVRFDQHQLEQTLAYLSNHPDVNEVILSGGDPLMASDHQLQRIIAALADIPTLKRVRVHSRLPVVIPARITQELVVALTATRLKASLVIHANHANEISPSLGESMAVLRQAGVHLFNQSVLLKGVNDTPDALVNLSERLFDIDVLPYYLHQLDKVIGAAHFEVTDTNAQYLWQQMNIRLPGFLVPKLVREVGGENSKTPIMPDGNVTTLSAFE